MPLLTRYCLSASQTLVVRLSLHDVFVFAEQPDHRRGVVLIRRNQRYGELVLRYLTGFEQNDDLSRCVSTLDRFDGLRDIFS